MPMQSGNVNVNTANGSVSLNMSDPATGTNINMNFTLPNFASLTIAQAQAAGNAAAVVLMQAAIAALTSPSTNG
jgi:hypothetical protein